MSNNFIGAIFSSVIGTKMLLGFLSPKTKAAKPTSFEEIEFPLCDEGEEKTAVFGQVWSPGWMVLTVGNMRTRAIKSKSSKK